MVTTASVETTYGSESLRELAERVLSGSDLLKFYSLVIATGNSVVELNGKEKESRFC